MKFLLVIVVVGVVLWLMFGRTRRVGKTPPPAAAKAAGPVQMVACAHCGLNLPRNEALEDGAGQSFCSEAHRVAGPR
jgi:uncharacterized protein